MMERWLPSTLFGRLALLLMVAVVASHFMALTLLFEWLPRPPPPGSPPPNPGWRWPGMLLDVGVRLGVLLLAAWVGARWLSRPLQQLARAAQALGDHIDRPPMEETGTAECREATRVFNRMQLRIRQHIAERERFLAAVSHDLRTPLTRMRLRAESLAGLPQCQPFLRDIADMQAMIDATLDYLSGMESPEPVHPVDVVALLQSLADDLAEGGHEVAVSGDVPPCRAQPMALRRCLDNLVGNAVRYGERAWVRCRDEPGRLVIEVQDNGPGVPEAELVRVTEPFYRLEASRHKDHGGVGLGLSIAQEVARRHGGTLVLSNVPGGGLLATLALPR